MFKRMMILVGVCTFLATGCGQRQESQTVAEKQSETLQSNKKEKQNESLEIAETETTKPGIASDYTGVASKDDKLFYFTNGKIDDTYTGLAEFEKDWLYINNGVVDYNYTGVAYKDDGLWYVNNGKIDVDYTGTVDYLGSSLNVKNGYIDSTLSIEKSDDAIIDVPKSEINVVFEASDDIYERSYTDQTTPTIDEFEFTSGEKGLYRVIAEHRTADNGATEYSGGTFLKFESSILDKFRKELGKHTGELRNRDYDANIWSLLLNANDKYIFSDSTKKFTRIDDKYIGNRKITVLFLKPYIDISGATVVNDSFNEDVFDYTITMHTDDAFTFASYAYTPSESGNYTFWFDNIEISRGKELFSENNLFYAVVEGEDKALCSKEVYVNGKDTQMQAYLEKGQTYQLNLGVRNVDNSEVYHNGDVSFRLHIGQENNAKDITGYTSIDDGFDYAGQKQIYKVTPCRKQTIKFVVSDVEENAKLNVKVCDASGNEIYSYSDLGNGDKFEMENAMKNSEYEIIINCNEASDYVLSVSYQ